MNILEKLRQPTHNVHIGAPLNKGSVNLTPTVLRGYKRVTLWVTGTNLIQFKSPTHGGHYNIDAIASCEYGKDHSRNGKRSSFKENCTCGFYAFKTEAEAWGYKLDRRNEGLVIETAISGEYYEYDGGFRYEKQRVTKIITRNCEWAMSHNGSPKAVAFVHNRFNELMPVCQEHADHGPFSDRVISFDRLVSALGRSESFKHKLPTVESFAL